MEFWSTGVLRIGRKLSALGYDLEPAAVGEFDGSRFSVYSFFLRSLRSFAAIPF